MPSGFDQKQSLLERKKKTQSQQDKNGRVAGSRAKALAWRAPW